MQTFEPWFEALTARHLEQLQFSEVRRGVTALSAIYVQKRDRLAHGAALDGAGKRAAFALFYTPLHFLLVDHIVRGLAAYGMHTLAPAPPTVVDLGCGTGAAAAAWGCAAAGHPRIVGIDTNSWALAEMRWNLRTLGLQGRAHRGDITTAALPTPPGAIVAAFSINEIAAPQARQALLQRLLHSARGGARVLIVEPIAGGPTPWWPTWESTFLEAGGRTDTWRFTPKLPTQLALLDKAAGLRHDELTGRSLYLEKFNAR